MSDDRKDRLEGLGDLDWDSALDEWEKNTFVPEIARDAETNRVVSPLGKDAESDDRQPPTAPPPAASEPPPTVPPDAPEARTLKGSLIAPAPREIRDEPSVPTRSILPRTSVPAPRGSIPSPRASVPSPRTSAPPSMRGGLDQLFSRTKSTPSARPELPLSRPPPERTRSAPASPLLRDPASVVPHVPALADFDDDGTFVDIDKPAKDAESLESIIIDDFRGDLRDAETVERPSAQELQDQDGAPTVSTRALGAPINYAATSIEALSDGPDDYQDEGSRTAVMRERESLSDADTATRLPADDEMPTLDRPSSVPAGRVSNSPTATSRESRPAPTGPTSFEGERPVSRWLDQEKAQAFVARITWLEEEARATDDPTARGRALLAVSELCALVGDASRAHAFATEARDVAPHLPLAWRQARQLMPRDPEELAEALTAEAARSPTPSARAHAVLLAADVLRIHERGDAAVERWDSAYKLDPTDIRAPLARAALALAQDDHTSGALRLAENSELVSLDKALATALRLRGVERSGAEFQAMPINDGLRHTRTALAAGDVVAAAHAAAEIAAVPEVAKGALWLSAALGAVHIASRRSSARSLKTLTGDGDPLARRQLAARGIELGDPELVSAALADASTFDPAERAVLNVLTTPKSAELSIDGGTIAELERDANLSPLVDALASMAPAPASDDDAAVARAKRVAGNEASRPLATLGRLLASNARHDTIDEALAAIAEPRPASAGGVAIETAVRGKRWADLSEALSSLPSGDDASGTAQRQVAAAIIAERAGNRERAKEAWNQAAQSGRFAADGMSRIAADLDPELDLAAALLRIAEDMPDGVASAVLRLEALARSEISDEEQAEWLERVHRAAPGLGIGGFLAEHVARRRGDVDEVVRWIQERRGYANEPLETALDAVREALLVADRDPELASTRLEEAHRARPDDVALRELHERLAPEPPSDRGAWREKRAERTEGPGAALLWIEAALEHERAGNAAATLRAARKAAEAGDQGLSRPIALRAQLETGDTTELTDHLIAVTQSSEDETIRREAFERLASLDAFGKKDPAAALRWHRSILEHTPHHKPSLRWVEHAFIGEGRDEELAGVFERIAVALDGSAGGESTAHAQHAARLFAREALTSTHEGPSVWDRTHDMTRLAATQPEPSLWALRALNAHARSRKDDEAFFDTTVALLERTHRSAERASLLLRAGEAATRLERVEQARTFVEQAAAEDPGDVVTWGFLAEIYERAGESRLAAEACESLARASGLREHQLLAWHDAAKIWLDVVKDNDRAIAALEAASEIDVTYADIFPRLSALYAEKNLDAELARLLERRLDSVDDDDERVALEVELSRAFADMGELAKAKVCLESALEKRPDHTSALGAMADLCLKEADWAGAELASIRLARLLSDPAEQRAIYERLGEIYSIHAPNLARAEVAFKEILKRSPGDLDVLAKLVDVYKRQADVPRAVEVQQEIVAASTDPDARLSSLVELAKIHETVGRDPRKSERVLDSARKEFPTSVVALRAMAEFYSRQRQMPAMQILLDRAAGDARRAFAQGRFVPSLFQVLHAAFELRGKRDAARVVAATLAAVEGQHSALMGAEARAVDPRLDELLAPEMMSPALRALLYRAGDTLDAVANVDLRVLKATPLQPGTPIGSTIGSVATVIGLGALQILVSPHLGRVALPLSSNPPTLLIGEGLARAKNEPARVFVVVRAMKMILAHGSAMLRGQPHEVSGLVAGLFNALNPSFVPQGLDTKKVAELSRRIAPALPKNLDPTVGVIALEAAGTLGSSWSSLGPAAHAWANRVALLAVGDPNAALDAIAWGQNEDAAPTGSEERAAWIARHAEARELMTFSVTDAYAEARMQLGLDR